jgi:hypothetical protein
MPRNETVRTPKPMRLKVGILTLDGTSSVLGNAIEVAVSTEDDVNELNAAGNKGQRTNDLRFCTLTCDFLGSRWRIQVNLSLACDHCSTSNASGDDPKPCPSRGALASLPTSRAEESACLVTCPSSSCESYS